MEITVQKLMIDNKLELIAGKDGLSTVLTEDMIARPGVEFAGFFDFFDYKRVILIGSKEAMFLAQQNEEVSKKNVKKIFELEFGNIHTYDGNYQLFLQEKVIRLEMLKASQRKLT